MALSNAVLRTAGDGIYEPLAVDQMRILHVLGVSGNLFICEFKTVSISDPGMYFAVSHVWGNQAKDQPILLNGEPASITRNVLELLQAIGNVQDRKGFVHDLWIDSLCINQDSASELEAQIPRMDEIYGQATCVYIFLSNLSGTAELVCETLYYIGTLSTTELEMFTLDEPYDPYERKHTLTRLCLAEPEFGQFARLSGLSADNVYAFYELVKVLTNFFRRPPLEVNQEVLQRLVHRQQLPPANHPFWLSIIEFMHHEWFYRVWTYQEVMLAPVSALLWKRREVIIWWVVRDCRRVVLNSRMESLVFGSQQSERLKLNLGYNPFLMTHQLEQFIYEGRESTLGSLLSQSMSRKALHRKDHVYGLLGLVYPAIKENIMIDYSVSDAEIYAQAFKATIQFKSSDLSRLWEAFDTRWGQLQGLPSWCPDLSLSTADMELTLLRMTPWKECTLPESYRDYKQAEQTDDMNTIGIVGMRLDGISFCTSELLPRHRSLWPEAELALEEKPPKASRVSRLFGHRSSASVSATAKNKLLHIIDVCFRQESCTWILSLREAFHKLGLDDRALCDHFFLLVIPELAQQIPFDTVQSLLLICETLVTRKPPSPGAHLDSIGLDPVKLAAQIAVMDAILTRLSRTYVFITGNRRPGLSIHQMRPGDNVIYVADGLLLKVLSRNCDRYRGCAVVPGVVGHELPESPEQARGRWQTFWIS